MVPSGNVFEIENNVTQGDDEHWPIVVVGIGQQGEKAANRCRGMDARLQYLHVAELEAFDWQMPVLAYVFADLAQPGCKQQLDALKGHALDHDITTIVFVVGSCKEEPQFAAPCIHTIPLSGTQENWHLAGDIALELSRMVMEIEPICIDTADLRCVARGFALGHVAKVVIERGQSVYQAVGAALAPMVNPAGAVVARLVGGLNRTLEDFTQVGDAIEDTFGEPCTQIVGWRTEAEYASDQLEIYLITFRK